MFARNAKATTDPSEMKGVYNDIVQKNWLRGWKKSYNVYGSYYRVPKEQQWETVHMQVSLMYVRYT